MELKPVAIETEIPRQTQASGAPRAGLHVLVVEDNEADAHLIELALREQGAAVGAIEIAKDGVEALELLDASLVSPDLAIIDLQMPRMDGFRLLIEMACRGHDGFPIVVLTSSTAKNDIVRSLFRGASKVISKPHSLEGLNREIATTIAAL
jgi:CheY-like chemotaxis protein